VVANATAAAHTIEQVEVQGWFSSLYSLTLGSLVLLYDFLLYVWSVPVLFYIILSLILCICYLVIWPVCRYFLTEIKARCKPKYFPYSHVVITGCGTGLGKALVEKIFQRGAMITMIGKDKAKLQQVVKEIDLG